MKEICKLKENESQSGCLKQQLQVGDKIAAQFENHVQELEQILKKKHTNSLANAGGQQYLASNDHLIGTQVFANFTWRMGDRAPCVMSRWCDAVVSTVSLPTIIPISVSITCATSAIVKAQLFSGVYQVAMENTLLLSIFLCCPDIVGIFHKMCSARQSWEQRHSIIKLLSCSLHLVLISIYFRTAIS